MKKIVLLFMSAMALSLAISCNKDNDPIIEFKDPLVLQALIKSYDENGDGHISQNEANEVTRLELSNLGIRSFDEISYFPNVKNIFLQGNQLTSLDVSNNMFLESLNCNNNQLTTLNVNNNLLLESLSCKTNLLTTLDVSSNVALYSLNIADNQLTSIDLRNNINLERFYCMNNKLTVLDLSKNKLIGDEPTNFLLGNPLKKLIISYYGMFREGWRVYYKDIIEYVYN